MVGANTGILGGALAYRACPRPLRDHRHRRSLGSYYCALRLQQICFLAIAENTYLGGNRFRYCPAFQIFGGGSSAGAHHPRVLFLPCHSARGSAAQGPMERASRNGCNINNRFPFGLSILLFYNTELSDCETAGRYYFLFRFFRWRAYTTWENLQTGALPRRH